METSELVVTGLVGLAAGGATIIKLLRDNKIASADADAALKMLADYERRAKEAEAETEALRVSSKAEIDRLRDEARKADGAARDAEGDLRAARRTIAVMNYRLEKAGVPDSERAALMTSFGDFHETPKS
jgi:chromosome segregation ATPase